MCQVSKPLGEDHDYWMWGGLGLKPLACYMTLSMSLTLDDSAQWLEYRFWSLNDQLNDLHRIPYLCASLIFLTNRATYFLGMLRLLIENTYHHACHAMSNQDCILKSRHYFANKGPSSQSYGFSSSHVWMWEVDYKESWAPKNWCFWTVVLGRLLRVPWTARRSNQSILKEISPGCSLEGLMLKLKLQYFSHLMRRTNWLEKTLTLGKIEGGRRRAQ